jgi:hypothetical protein
MLASAPCPLAFDAASHTYRLNGAVVPSVTQVLRASGYVDFYRDLAQKIAEGELSPGDGTYALIQRGQKLVAARDRGQRVHNALHFLIEDDLDNDSIDEETRGYLESGRKYLETYVRHIFRAEFRVWTTRFGCAGTLDILALHADGGVFIGDWKSGNPEDVAAWLQLGAYQGFSLEMAESDQELRREMYSHGPRVKRRSMRLYRDGRIAKETLYTDPSDYSKFLGALALVHDQQRRPLPILAWDDER